MTARRQTVNPPRTRHSMDFQGPRHMPRTPPEDTCTYTAQLGSVENFTLVSGAPQFCPELATCWPNTADSFHPGNDSAYIPATWVSPNDLMHQNWDMLSNTDLESSCTSSSGSTAPTSAPISPPISEAEMLPAEMYHHNGMEAFSQYTDPWVHPLLPPSPPEDAMFDNLDLFSAGKHDQLGFAPLPEPAMECEYLGPSKLQFSRAPVRQQQPRAIRSASERSPAQSAGSSPKDESMERAKNNPRNDPRYDAKPDKDGIYHCPFTGSEGCTHQPTKQKCIYAKNLDSHLKPYICKYGPYDENCRSLRFSSNACLFRHEREMHGLHNHGINPYHCLYPGCERAREDNGFPRRWNQRDHMKRVHGWEENDENDSGSGYSDMPRRRKGPGASQSVAMKRTGSSRAQANYYNVPRNLSAPRYAAHVERVLQVRNILAPGMPIDPVHYTHQTTMASAYGTGPLYV